MNQLKETDSIQLIKEINFATNIMEKIFPTDRINVAAIGNNSHQLHIHIISRTKNSFMARNNLGSKNETSGQ